jgi:hypothetical protein
MIAELRVAFALHADDSTVENIVSLKDRERRRGKGEKGGKRVRERPRK